MPLSTNNSRLFALIERAIADGNLSLSAASNVKAWLVEPRYADFFEQVSAHILEAKWQVLDDVFWTAIPFGTAGRRGRMYPIGCNAINDRTIGESAQGLADYVKYVLPAGTAFSCGIAYDTRHKSEHFARLCAEIMTAAGFKVYFLQGHRSTPELSFLVRHKACSCGIMVTASHNPPTDNAVKIYWSTGGQILPPHDEGIIKRVMTTQTIERANFDEMLIAGRIDICQEEIDSKFYDAVLSQSSPGPRELHVVYSPLHGVGTHAAVPVMRRDGFNNLEVFGPHAIPDGDFPNVADNVANPEIPKVFDKIIERAQTIGADLALATDPDCDRIGCAAPLTFARNSRWQTLTGNQIGALLADYVLGRSKRAGRYTPDHFIVITLVTTQLIRRIGDSYGVRTVSDLLVGFKWIAKAIDEFGAKDFLFGTEEAHGYMAGTYVRDKDGALASMLICELAAELKANNETLHEKLDALFRQHGAHMERTLNVPMPGSDGMLRMLEVMAAFRANPPAQLGGIRIAQVRDYMQKLVTPIGGKSQPLAGPQDNLVILDLERDGNYVACRPSGTEPKIKFYLFDYLPTEQLSNLEAAKAEQYDRLDAVEADLRQFACI